MLGKLLKYEFKATARIFLLMYAALLVVAGLNAAILPLNDNILADFLGRIPYLYDILSSLSIFLYILVLGAVFVMTTVIIIIRFYRMLGDQGYLWFTLPVTTDQHIVSKLIVAFVWSLSSSVVAILSIGLLALPTGWVSELWRIPELWNSIVGLGFNPGLWIACFLLTLVASLIYSTLMFYSAMAIGPNFLKSRLGGSVLTYVIMYVAIQIVTTILLLVISGPLIDQAEIIAQASGAGMVYSPGMDLAGPDLTAMSVAINKIILISTLSTGVMQLALATGFYFTTRYFIARKLNLA